MKKDLSLVLTAIVVLALIYVLFVVGVGQVRANPSSIVEYKTASATTTLNSIQGGLGTTTKAVDLQSDNAPADSAALLLRFNASSTNAVLKWRYEFSQGPGGGVDCSVTQGLCDWYSESINNATATATSTQEVQTFKEYFWEFASSTPGGMSNPQDFALKQVTIPTPTRFVRVVIYMAPTTGSSTVWAEIVTKRENR